MIDGKFSSSTKKKKKHKVTYENLRRTATVQEDDSTTDCLLDYIYFKKYYKMIAVDLGKQHALDADLEAIQQTNFTENLKRAGNTRFYFIIEEANKTVFDFSEGTVKVSQLNVSSLIFISIKSHNTIV